MTKIKSVEQLLKQKEPFYVLNNMYEILEKEYDKSDFEKKHGLLIAMKLIAKKMEKITNE